MNRATLPQLVSVARLSLISPSRNSFLAKFCKLGTIFFFLYGVVGLNFNASTYADEKSRTAKEGDWSSVSLEPVELRIAAASDLTYVLKELAKTYTKNYPNRKIQLVFGSSGSFVTQIQQGAYYDLFFSADERYIQALLFPSSPFQEMKPLGKKDLPVPLPSSLARGAEKEGDPSRSQIGESFFYGRGHLVLWMKHGSSFSIQKGLSVLLDPKVRKIAIAHPLHAPYGRAALEAIRRSELKSKVESKLVYAENVAQAAHFVQSGAAEIGLIALSLAQAPELKKMGSYQELADELNDPLVQSAAILYHEAVEEKKGVKENEQKNRSECQTKKCQSALDFKRYVLGEVGQNILRTYGITPEIKTK